MSGSIAAGDQEFFPSERSVGSCLSSSSGRKSKRFEMSGMESALYLPTSLRVPVSTCDRSLQELDETVASVSKSHSSKNILDNGERSPTSVAQDIAGQVQPALSAEEVLEHLSQPMPLHFRRVESGSGRSNITRSSIGSKSLGGSRRSRGSAKKRRETLEEKISQAVQNAASHDSVPDSEGSKHSAWSAQFILTDLFHEASKNMDESALPRPPFGDGTSWSQIQFEKEVEEERLEATIPTVSLRSRGSYCKQIDCHAQDEVPSASTGEIESIASHSLPNADPPGADLFIDSEKAVPTQRTLGDIIRDAETESESSAFFMHDDEEERATSFTAMQDNRSRDDPSECIGTLDFSMDESMLQYSSTNGTSTFSHASRADDNTIFQPSFGGPNEQKNKEWGQALEPNETENWTVFEESPFHEVNNDDFGFAAFSPFEDYSETQPKKSPIAGTDPAWDASRAHPVSSPDSPSSVFHFFSTDDEDLVAADSRSDTLWNISDVDFQKATF